MSITNIDQYGIVERKKEELDELNNQILDAQFDVDQYDAMVTSLSQKLNRFEVFLADADAQRTKALNNKNLLNEVLQKALDLRDNSNIAYNEMSLADAMTKDLGAEIKKLIDELIFAAEVINKFATMVVRKKANNPLISEELMEMIKVAGDDANNAVALTLVALKSIYSSQATNMEAEAAAALEYLQARKLYGVLSGTDSKGEKSENYEKSLKFLLKDAYDKSKKAYEKMLKANKDTKKQLDHARKQYDKAFIKLNSLKSGYEAATAAAYAS